MQNKFGYWICWYLIFIINTGILNECKQTQNLNRKEEKLTAIQSWTTHIPLFSHNFIGYENKINE